MAMMGDAVLMVQGGTDEGNSINLPKGMLVMGRGPLNDVVLGDTAVSRQHAGIKGDSEGYWIADLGSQNGTFVNGERLDADPRRLQNFDKNRARGHVDPRPLGVHGVPGHDSNTRASPRAVASTGHCSVHRKLPAASPAEKTSSQAFLTSRRTAKHPPRHPSPLSITAQKFDGTHPSFAFTRTLC